MKNNNDPTQPPAPITPEEILALDQHIEEMNKTKTGPGRKLTARGILDLDYDKYMWKNSKETDTLGESIEELSAPIAENSENFKFKMPLIDKVVEKIGNIGKLSAPTLDEFYEQIPLSKVKYTENRKVKSKEFYPSDRVNLKQHLRNTYNILPNMFEFGAIIIDVLSDFWPDGQVIKTYILKEYIPCHYPKPKNQQHLKFQVLEGQDNINNYLEVWNENADVQIKKKIGVCYSNGSVGSICRVNLNTYYYDEVKSFMPSLSDEECAEMYKKVEQEFKKQNKSYWSKPPERRKTGHPLTNQFKRD